MQSIFLEKTPMGVSPMAGKQFMQFGQIFLSVMLCVARKSK
jgi:hypothetical protein